MFFVVNPEVTVQLHGGMPRRETVYPPLAKSNLLFMTSGQMDMVTRSVNQIFHPRRGGPLPPGVQIPRGLFDLLRAYLPQYGCGVSSGIAPIAPSVPEVKAVEFTDEARTRATVRLSSAPGIGTVYLEKESGL